MVRASLEYRRCLHHFPRIRGDGPALGIKIPMDLVFSPYSRGWSPVRHPRRGLASIFPVFAGMVRTYLSGHQVETYFPRIRGDGPDALGMAALQKRFSPYSRGWSLRWSVAQGEAAIFPVFAGMVRCTLQTSYNKWHFPRIRGDGPHRGMASVRYSTFSPYSRGWSLAVSGTPFRGKIFPVFAGMVPAHPHQTRSACHFPRIRGDGPGSGHFIGVPSTFSPYSRGWSRHDGISGVQHSIFPVFAGMVPVYLDVWFMADDFPRIRGDGPTHASHNAPTVSFSPYSRGWSPRCCCIRQRHRIFPVFAGMVPPQGSLSGSNADFPRIRGDGPYYRLCRQKCTIFSPYSRGWSLIICLYVQVHDILPVFAGMVLSVSGFFLSRPYFPRIRGDGPNHDNPDPQRRAFSPYSRGWSGISPAHLTTLKIFPVFAGMIPDLFSGVPSASYSPRIRGDDPCSRKPNAYTPKFSPYSRG